MAFLRDYMYILIWMAQHLCQLHLLGSHLYLFYLQILRSHVMVRVGGGWDTLSHYLDKHDPCRCRAQHRSSLQARLMIRNTSNSGNGIELHKAHVIYER